MLARQKPTYTLSPFTQSNLRRCCGWFSAIRRTASFRADVPPVRIQALIPIICPSAGRARPQTAMFPQDGKARHPSEPHTFRFQPVLLPARRAALSQPGCQLRFLLRFQINAVIDPLN